MGRNHHKRCKLCCFNTLFPCGTFDTENAVSSEATGFVVDASRGLILTNRHVVGPGPFTGYVVFDNHESVDVKPIFRDPIHDFGILKIQSSGRQVLEVNSTRVGTRFGKSWY